MRVFPNSSYDRPTGEKASCGLEGEKNAKDLTEKKIVKLPHLSGWNEGVQRVGGADRAWKHLEREWRHKSISS